MKCHAILIYDFPDGRDNAHLPRAIPLNGLSPSKAQEWRRRLNLSLGLQPARKSRPANVTGLRGAEHTYQVLREIWTDIVEPIFDALEIRSVRALPNIYMCLL